VRVSNGTPCPPGEIGMILVRGPQVAGEYREGGALTDEALVQDPGYGWHVEVPVSSVVAKVTARFGFE